MSFRVLALSAVLCCVLARTVPRPQLDEHWEIYKDIHNKKYVPEEEHERRLIWEDNLDFIQRHNLEYDLGLRTHTVAVNSFADLTSEEYRQLYLGYRPNQRNKTALGVHNEASLHDIPDEIDWRDYHYVTRVKDQGKCASGWAFSAAGALEAQHFGDTGNLVPLSAQNLVDCDNGSSGCEGGNMDSAFKYVFYNGGIDTDLSYPYTARKGSCKFSKSNVGDTDLGLLDVKPRTEDALQSAVATSGPISAAIDASHQSFRFYSGGIYNEPHCSSSNLDHGVLVVGYGTGADGDYWIVKNSYGIGWGENGYIRMSRNKNNQCGIASEASFPVGFSIHRT
ncbi:procathepsin L-like [Ornithodoros turicata]|uniref:procathepsin L-like n=1 Tax=Ornithodoros turicata TaxID=34597 RepID=UPI003138A8C7